MIKRIFAIVVSFFMGVVVSGGVLISLQQAPLGGSDKEFLLALEKNLWKVGDRVMATNVHGGEWTKICAVIEYSRASLLAAHELGIDKSLVKMRGGNNWDYIDFADETTWGYVFLYPPAEAEFLRIPIRKFPYGGSKGCVDKDDALFELMPARLRGETPGIRLTKKGE